MLRPALMSILLSTAMVSAPFFTPAYAETYSFSQLVVEGNERVDATTILSYAGIAKGESIISGALNDAYQRIVDAGLFETVELIPQGGTLLIRVQEYPMLNVVDFQGNKALKDENLAEVVKSRSRLVYSPAQAEADATSISEIYRVQGRLAASVTPRIIRRDDNRVDLVFEIAEGKVVEVERLSFVGNRAFSDRRLRQVLETKQAGFLRQLIKGDTFVAERLEVDKQMLRDFYLSRGYVDVQVLDASGELARERDASFVAFTIREGQQFKLGKISTVSELEGVDVAEFVDVQKLRSGVVYSPAIIENNIARMESLALRKGLNFVQIEPRITRNERDQTLDIEFVLKRGEKIFVERIDVEGNTTTLDQVVRRQFRTVEGDPFNPREIRQSAERIRALGFFADAKVESQPGSDGDQVVVKVDVEEQPTGSLSFGASYGLSSGVGLNIGFSESNFLGRGQGLSLNITSGTDSNEGSLTFVEPAFLGRDLKLKFSGYYRETTQASASYDTSNILVSPALDFPVSANSRLEVRLKYFQDTMTNYTGESDLLLGEATGSMAGAGIGYTYSYDTRVNGMNPNGGILLRFGQDFVGLGGDIKYLSTSALALAETKIFNEEVTVRTVFEGGMLNSFDGYQTRVTDRFFGNGKVRGFETNGYGPMDGNPLSPEAVGGNVFAVAKFEADFPLGLPEEYGINGGVFFDIGSVWGLDNTDGTGPDPIDDSFKLRSAVGFSVFWKTPIGPLRFNFSKALLKEVDDKEQTFDLTISTKF
ncbi:MAG: outer membrane protein assembly factor BamA [Rhodobacterales bacterium RIFCSPHIGHO2_02_FULL_62_130]|nr:MAG: outer membrane protein assembly factor BamA [Rhodobacterales bacterium RIFCSPHIGHO2_02_FULL_62_130]OHC56616.1 MAG: outer membrane protein assembly factor BamA [Rhodobacterales bacterium RIFCSPHIGHO2_12_FULL_62_75]